MYLLLISAILLLGLNEINANQIIELKRGDIYNLESPNYPHKNTAETGLTWQFETQHNQKLQIQCSDFRIQDTPHCLGVHLLIDDGKSTYHYCGNRSTLKIVSASNKLRVKLNGKQFDGAIFSCFVKSLATPKPTKLNVITGRQYIFKHFKYDVKPFLDRMWELVGEEGSRLRLKCYTDLHQTDLCKDEALTIDVGDGSEAICGFHRGKSFTTKRNIATVRLELSKTGIGEIQCAVRTLQINEINTEFEANVGPTVGRNLAQRTDSSEHGLISRPGQKGTTCNCGWTNKPPARIIHGREASPNEYPWIVALKAYFGPEAHINCSGSLITHHHILTAAHCLVNMYVDMSSVVPKDVHVYVGIHNIDNLTPKDSFKEYRASQHFIRKEFLTQYTHDFAIVVVKEEIEFTRQVGPICLSPKRIAEPLQTVTIIGWGITENRHVSSVLLKAKTTVLEQRKCTDINKYEICTRADKSATCTGDSGGPLSWLDPETNRYTLMSLVSYGDPDCISTPSVSTDISFFYSWIQDTIKATYPEEMTCIKQ